jgi:hypothetical protein
MLQSRSLATNTNGDASIFCGAGQKPIDLYRPWVSTGHPRDDEWE